MGTTSALAILRDVFGYPAFRGAQAEIIDHIGNGGDALVLMPTGGTFYYVYNSVSDKLVDVMGIDDVFCQPMGSNPKSAFRLTSKFTNPLQYSLF